MNGECPQFILPVVPVRVCVYCAISGLSNTVAVPSVNVVESLVNIYLLWCWRNMNR